MRKVVFGIFIAVFYLCGCTTKPTQNGYVRSAKAPEWSLSSTIYEVNIRQFSEEGTIAAVEAQLPRLKEMGVDILWLMPVHPIGELNRKGGKGSYYAVKDYLDINPEYGTKEDFKRFVERAHKLGMKVILDWVANHTAWDNALATDHPDWYTKNAAGEFVPPVADWADVIDLNFENPDLRAYMKDAMVYWVQEFDIDGYRCDVAGMVPAGFWNEARVALETVKPVFMLAEAEEGEHQLSAFDLSYGWKMHHAFNMIAQGKETPAAIDSTFATYSRTFPKGSAFMLFTSNHDENSWNGTEFERMGDGADVFFVLSATLPGMPLVYTGQESALNRRLAFFEKDPVSWKNYEKAPFFKTLLQLKRRNAALFHGEKAGEYIRINGPEGIFAFLRRNGEKRVLVVTNLTPEERGFFVETGYPGTYTDVFTGKQLTSDGTLQGVLPAWGWWVLEQ